MNRQRILLADDHQIFLEGLKKLLEPNFELVGEAHDGEDLVRKATQLQPDLIIADISMPRMSGLVAWNRIKETDPTAKLILLTMHDDPEYAREALDSEVSGYVLKNSASIELLTAIEYALNNRVYVTPLIAGQLFESLSGPKVKRPRGKAALTPRQREVLQLLARGLVAKQIAEQLGVSRRTVEYHKYKMMEILGTQTTAELLQYSVKHGLIRD